MQAAGCGSENSMGIENPVHLLFIALVALLVLGPKRLPKLARAVGQGIREFRGALEQAASEPAESTTQPPETPAAAAHVPETPATPAHVPEAPTAPVPVPAAAAQLGQHAAQAQSPAGQPAPPASEPEPPASEPAP
jgi:TatA/E family protein of Tat protein translocase